MPIVFYHCERVEIIRTKLEELPHDPVVYRWWFPAIPEVIGKADINFDKIEQRKIEGKLYYALYVGIGIDCQQRFSWHIAQHHKPSNVTHGTLSTLRQTLSAVIGIDMTKAEDVVNKKMDTCYLEWILLSGKSKTDLEKIESGLLCDGYYPLNIQKNPNIPASWKRELTNMRKIHKK